MLTKRTQLLLREIADQCRGHGCYLTDPHISTYRRLIKKIFNFNLTRTYPLTSSFLDTAWSFYIDSFTKKASIDVHQVADLGECFYHWLISEQKEIKVSLVIQELMRFELAESQLFTMCDCNPHQIATKGNYFTTPLIVNQESILLIFSLPVYKKKVQDIVPDDKGVYFLFMYRHPKTKYIHMYECSQLAAFVLEILKKDTCCVQEILMAYFQVQKMEFNPTANSQVIKLVDEFLKTKILLGFHPTKQEN